MHGIDEGGLETGLSATAPVLYSTETIQLPFEIQWLHLIPLTADISIGTLNADRILAYA